MLVKLFQAKTFPATLPGGPGHISHEGGRCALCLFIIIELNILFKYCSCECCSEFFFFAWGVAIPLGDRPPLKLTHQETLLMWVGREGGGVKD